MRWSRAFTQSPHGMLWQQQGCCIIGLCCTRAERLATIATALQANDGTLTDAQATAAATKTAELLDAMPFTPLMQAVWAHAAEHFAAHPPKV